MIVDMPELLNQNVFKTLKITSNFSSQYARVFHNKKFKLKIIQGHTTCNINLEIK